MSFRKKSSNNKKVIPFDEESVSESEYLTSVLSLVNGYCKVNLMVPQISSFYTSDSLLPINAKVNSFPLNNKIHNSQISNKPDGIADMLKNVVNIGIDENLDDKQFQSSDKKSVCEFQVYSKPSYSENSDHVEKNEDKKISVSPKGKKKKNKFNNKMGSTSSSLDNQTLVPSRHVQKEQNASTGCNNQYGNERLHDGSLCKQEQEIKKKPEKNSANIINAHLSRSRTSHLKQNTENEIQNKNSSLESQCPLCFRLYPTPDIEAHASECSI